MECNFSLYFLGLFTIILLFYFGQFIDIYIDQFIDTMPFWIRCVSQRTVSVVVIV